ncbi:hypothetical protein A3A74_04305 [Candidatus Roizmanbacteria bacterium RIFCSPLOWO2_01_FULL_35_13]|uniref:HicB-like antitoxin of toxin-antitoxin system domain-containing protein n=1 Tax=Candidatus Roizmanbacteria bacterium RIFCSPLOWO2_01_FULL_35_13 TaxID=1802055 RepID=A0A1F7IB95_9BACT|nr:MAG: hypothetical protein A3A74_04305 [Candidatus Roizmanbacteria bacterium RIFCSPLOWO2_01_FULL_35_13]
MKNYSFRTIIEPDDPKGYHGFVPILTGLHTSGDTILEVKKNMKEAIRCHIEGSLKDKLPIPQEEDTMEVIQTFSQDDFSSHYA